MAVVVVTDRGARHGRRPPPGFEAVQREHPGVAIELGGDRSAGPAPHRLDAEAWRAPTLDFYAFDRAMDHLASAGPLTLAIDGPAPELPAICLEVLTRCQRLLRRINAASSAPAWDRVRARHRALHDLTKPLVQADYDHALDAWQWTLRLEPEAGLAVQLAALFHDVERLGSEALVRVEHHARDYQAFKDAHAGRGAGLASALLAEAGVDEPTRRQVALLVRGHERRGEGIDAAVLADADALSFFSLNSPGFLSYYGPAHTRRKVAWTLARMRPAARARLAALRLVREVRAMIHEEVA